MTKLIKHHQDFYRYSIRLNPTRLKRLTTSVKSIQKFLDGTPFGEKIIGYQKQGSWKHNTMIQPLKGKEYDADLLLLMEPQRGWKCSDYIENLYSTLKKSRTYKAKVGRKSRCVTIDYKGDFHLDLVPCIYEEKGFFVFKEETYKVCNRQTGRYEKTDGPGFANWLQEQNDLVENDMVLKTIQIMKYLRDHKQTFSAKSILLTTLLAYQVPNWSPISKCKDIPTSLQTLLTNLDKYLQNNPKMPRVINPSMDDEDFNRHWDQIKYENFRARINTYKLRVDDAISETGTIASHQKWQNILGEDFGIY